MDAIKQHFRAALRDPANRERLIDIIKRIAVVRASMPGARPRGGGCSCLSSA
jgi:hypothetical protein